MQRFTSVRSVSSKVTSQSKNTLPFGYYLENRENFLSNLTRSVKSRIIADQEKKLLSILENTGSKNQVSAIETSIPANPLLSSEEFSPMWRIGPAKDSFTIRKMLACGMHLGHATSKWHPKMVPYIFGERAGIHILDLEKTLACLRVACQVVTDIAAKDGIILFVGTRSPIQRLTYECASECGQYFVNLRWLGGTITNKSHVLRNKKLAPDLVIVLDYPNNVKALRETALGNVPSIAICDSDCDPQIVTYPIPANDDAFASVELVARTLSLAAAEGKKFRSSSTSAAAIIESGTNFLKKTLVA